MGKKRVVVKIGSSSLTNTIGGLSESKLAEHTKALAQLIKQGHEVLLVSSGAVSAGFGDLGYPARPVTTSGKQAAAAVGQGRLIQSYTESFKAYGIVPAQLLLTKNDFTNKEQYSNAYSVLTELLKRSVLPIINENDSVVVDELTFGDNDMLAALVSGLVHADFLMILTDVNGLYEEDPRVNPQALRYDFLPEITEDLLQQTKSTSVSKFGTGGMKSKLLAAQTALSLGVNCFVGTGLGPDKCLDILDGKGDGTYIGHSPGPILKKPKQWLALHSQVSGEIQVDGGAARAITAEGKSLLPAGIRHISGSFDTGDVVEITTTKGEVIGKGQVNYSSAQLKMVIGLASQEAMQKTGGKRPEVIHRDHFVQIIGEALI
ncbi:glutamate 5-kinase [Scopulibacillus darangshiensis]|uniref:Glutamate 5-kinase n=1 Tax=Scopulibacillus darangshiensis TaxID=442528 RepID=A0A4R2P460_9BACL|nr:glutamate 5-kinase [Scopulibacillus darangshiensis]TCP29580.1 glutamate 5-kinase [Scopulibacillus darangshiensis]